MRWPWKPKFNPDKFRSQNWYNLRGGDNARLSQLQALENNMAKSQGRNPRTVVIDNSISNGGYYRSNGQGGGTIHVSENDLHNNSFECMDTVLHEGRHAYQDDVINDRIPNSETVATKESWAHDDAPERNVEVFKICPLNEDQIEKYVDKIILLKKFEKADKETFLKQSKVLVEKGFLNSLKMIAISFCAGGIHAYNLCFMYDKCSFFNF